MPFLLYIKKLRDDTRILNPIIYISALLFFFFVAYKSVKNHKIYKIEYECYIDEEKIK